MANELFRVNIIGEVGSGKSSVSQELERDGFEVIRPGDIIRDYARGAGVELGGRKDSVALHREMLEDDPDIIVRPILASPARLLAISGLRVYAHGRRLAQEVGLHTIALGQGALTDDEWEEMRYLRVLQSQPERGYRDLPHLVSRETFRADEDGDRGHTSDLDPNTPRMMAMAQERGATIDASQPLERVVADVRAYIASQLQNP